MKHATLPHPSTGRPFPPRPARTALSLLSLLTSAALSACSGGGGGGSSGDDGDTAVNEGSFTLDDFDYQSTHPPGYQPLGADGYQVLAREELFATWPGRDGVSRAFRLQEGPDAGHAKVPEIDALLAGQGIVQSAAGGQLDRDAESELVVATLAPAGSSLTLHRIDRLLRVALRGRDRRRRARRVRRGDDSVRTPTPPPACRAGGSRIPRPIRRCRSA